MFTPSHEIQSLGLSGEMAVGRPPSPRYLLPASSSTATTYSISPSRPSGPHPISKKCTTQTQDASPQRVLRLRLTVPQIQIRRSLHHPDSDTRLTTGRMLWRRFRRHSIRFLTSFHQHISGRPLTPTLQQGRPKLCLNASGSQHS